MRRPGAIIIGVLTVLGFLIPLAEAASAPVDSFPSTAVGVALTPGGQGWWVAGANGSVTPGGNAPFYGSVAGIPLGRPVVGIAATPGGRGYWLVASDGGIFSFGDAAFFGSTGSIRLNKPIVGMASTPGGRGYWPVASDGGMATSGAGYALATTNGLVAAFGTAATALGVPAGQPQSTPRESPPASEPGVTVPPAMTSSPGQPTGSGGAGTPSGEAMPTG